MSLWNVIHEDFHTKHSVLTAPDDHMPYIIQLHIVSIRWAYYEQMKQQNIGSVHMTSIIKENRNSQCLSEWERERGRGGGGSSRSQVRCIERISPPRILLPILGRRKIRVSEAERLMVMEMGVIQLVIESRWRIDRRKEKRNELK